MLKELQSDHKEADSRMFVHVDVYGSNKVILWSIDTDVALICPKVGFEMKINSFFLKTGVGKQGQYIAIHDTVAKLSDDLLCVLSELYALSGCDWTISFSGIGKKRILKVIKLHPHLLQGISRLGSSADSSEDRTMRDCISLVSIIYGGKSYESSNDLRYIHFSKKNLGSDRLPPTDDAFKKSHESQLPSFHLE